MGFFEKAAQVSVNWNPTFQTNPEWDLGVSHVH